MMLRERLKIASLCASLVFALNLSGFGQENTYFTNWPAGLSPQEVGKRVAEHFVTSPHQYGATIHYSEVGTWYGGLTFASLTHDDALRTELIHRFEPLMPGGQRRRVFRCVTMWTTPSLAWCRWRSP
jgi:hypothetical protein